MIHKRLLIAAAMLIAATFAEAQQQLPPGKWWRREEVVRQLELTREQQGKLDEVFSSAANDLIDARANVEKLQVALRAELDRTQLRRQELQRLATQLSSARGKLFEREIMMLADMRGVLNEEQWTRLRTHLDRRATGERPMQRPGQRQMPRPRPRM